VSSFPPKVTVEERARRYVAAMPPSIQGQNGHDALFNVVRALIHGFGFTAAEARPFVDDYNRSSCDPAWSEGEINHKLRSVDNLASKWPRGYLRNEGDWQPSKQQRRDLGIPTESEVRKKISFELEKLQRIAAPWSSTVDLVWLANRSSVDPATLAPADFLRLLYRDGEKVLCFTNEYSQGDALWPSETPPAEGKLGVWFLPQPVSGDYMPNPEGKSGPNGEPPPPSRRIGRCVSAFRYLVIESDKAPMRDWLGFIVQAPLQIEALYTSGSRSIHALVRVDARTYEEWHQKKRDLMPFLVACIMVGGDKNTFSTAVRLSRLPGCVRHGKMAEGVVMGKTQRVYKRFNAPGEQKLLYVRPRAAARPICELSPERDVVTEWTKRARAAVDGHEDNSDELRRALRFYSSRNELCAALLRDLEHA
jgi:hypothetical protein